MLSCADHRVRGRGGVTVACAKNRKNSRPIRAARRVSDCRPALMPGVPVIAPAVPAPVPVARPDRPEAWIPRRDRARCRWRSRCHDPARGPDRRLPPRMRRRTRTGPRRGPRPDTCASTCRRCRMWRLATRDLDRMSARIDAEHVFSFPGTGYIDVFYAS